MRVIVIGAGIIGAALANQLAKASADVLVFDSHIPASGATAASFGWINASFYLDEHHFQFRARGLDAWHRTGLQDHLTWQGSLCWDVSDPSLESQRQAFETLNYPVELLNRRDIEDMEPHIVAPEAALRFQTEGVANPIQTTETLLKADKSINVVNGVFVRDVIVDQNRVIGVNTDVGAFHADRVILAAGTGTARFLDDLGLSLGFLPRPGLMLSTRPVRHILSHIIASHDQEFRQDSSGRIWAPMAANHQADEGSEIQEDVQLTAEKTMARLRQLLPSVSLTQERILFANRPMPQDRLPAIGQIGPEGLYVAVMHSGVTLAAIVAEVLTPAVLGDVPSEEAADLLKPYDPSRFNG